MLKIKSLSNEKGFTLVELMVSVAISVILMGAIFIALRSGNEQIQTMEVKMSIQDSAREGLYKMIQEIRQSAPSRITIGSGSTSGTTIQFEIPDPSNPINTNSSDSVQDYSVEWGSAITVNYALTSGQVIRTDVDAGTTTVVANDISAITFTGDSVSPELVTVSLSAQRSLINGQLIPATAMQFSGQAEVRNS